MRRAARIGLAGVSGVVTLLCASRSAPADGDALHGKRLYFDAARITGSGISCVDCHGGLPGGLYGIGRAADQPMLIENAVASVPAMTPLRGRLAPHDFVDLAAYIADPSVPSPDVAVTVRLPGGVAHVALRIDVGTAWPDRDEVTAEVQFGNAGQVPVTLTGPVELDGSDAGEFALSDGGCIAPITLAAGQACDYQLAFRPRGAFGTRTARLRVPHDWVQGFTAVALVGTAGDPAAMPSRDPDPDPSEPRQDPAGCSAGRNRGVDAVPGVLALEVATFALLCRLGRRRARAAALSRCSHDAARVLAVDVAERADPPLEVLPKVHDRLAREVARRGDAI